MTLVNSDEAGDPFGIKKRGKFSKAIHRTIAEDLFGHLRSAFGAGPIFQLPHWDSLARLARLPRIQDRAALAGWGRDAWTTVITV